MTDARRPIRVPMVARILLAMVLGALVGIWKGKDAERLGLIGTVLIDMIKDLAAPLLLFAILDAFLRTQVRARSGAIMVAISAVNAVIAIAVGLTLSNVLRPGDHFQAMSGVGDAKALKDFQERAKEIDFLRADIDTLRAGAGLEPRGAPLLGRYTEAQILGAIAAATEQGAGEPR